MSTEAKVAIYKWAYETEDFDTEEYESIEDAAEDLVEESRYDHYGVPVYEVDGMEVCATDDYDVAEEGAIQWNESVTEECGPGNFWEDYVEKEWFEEAQREMNESYAYDIKDESSSDEDMYVNRLHEELCDYGIMSALDLPEEPEQSDYQTDEGEDDEDAYNEAYYEWEGDCDNIRSEAESEAEDNVSELADKMTEDQGDAVEYYRDNFGDDDFNRVVKDNGLLDVRAYAEYCARIDGVAHALAGYDGEEYEQDGYYIYRTN